LPAINLRTYAPFQAIQICILNPVPLRVPRALEYADQRKSCRLCQPLTRPVRRRRRQIKNIAGKSAINAVSATDNAGSGARKLTGDRHSVNKTSIFHPSNSVHPHSLNDLRLAQFKSATFINWHD